MAAPDYYIIPRPHGFSIDEIPRGAYRYVAKRIRSDLTKPTSVVKIGRFEMLEYFNQDQEVFMCALAADIKRRGWEVEIIREDDVIVGIAIMCPFL